MGNFSVKTDGAWWKGEVTFRYNLLIPLLVFLYIGKGIVWLIKKLIEGIKKIFPFLILLFCTVGAALLAFWKWFKSLFKRKSSTGEPSENSRRYWWWLLPFLLLLAIILFCWKSCIPEKENVTVTPETPGQIYDHSFDKVVIARAYLDGVQKTVSSNCPRALVGFKFINDKPVKEYNFNGLTYEQSVAIVASNWKPVVLDNLNPGIALSEQKMAVVTLAAMRMGKNGFRKSDFLKKVNEGDFEGAVNSLLLKTADGHIRKTGDEPKQYFYVLRLLWQDQLDIDKLADFPMFSYKAVSVKEMYNTQGNHLFNGKILERLNSGHRQTPREALEL